MRRASLPSEVRRRTRRKGRNCYWNVASNMERGRADTRSASAGARVTRPPRLVDRRRRLALRGRRAERRRSAYGFERTIDEISSHALRRRGARDERRARRRSVRADEAGKPAAPAAPAQAAPAAAQPPPPSSSISYRREPQWAKFCAKEPSTGQATSAPPCATFDQAADQPPMISVDVFRWPARRSASRAF